MLRTRDEAAIVGRVKGAFWKPGTTVSWSVGGRRPALQRDVNGGAPWNLHRGSPSPGQLALGFRWALAGRAWSTSRKGTHEPGKGKEGFGASRAAWLRNSVRTPGCEMSVESLPLGVGHP